MFKKVNKIIKALIFYINSLNPVVTALALFIALLSVSIMTQGVRPLGCDMAEYLNNPLRILNGDLPYRDFWLLFTPGEILFPALVYKIFGLNTDAVLIATMIFSSLSAVCAYYLGRLILKKNFESIIFTLLFFFTSIVWTYEGPQYINIFLLFIVLSATFLIRYYLSGKFSELFLSGIFMGCSFVFRFYEVGAVFAGFLLGLLIYLIIYKKPVKYLIKTYAVYFSGVVLIILGLLIAYHDMIPVLYREIAVESLKNGTSMNLPYFSYVFEVLGSINNDITNLSAYKNFGAVLNLVYHLIRLLPAIFYYIIPFISIILFLVYLLTKPNKQNLGISLIFFLWGMFSFPKGLGRSDIAHLAQAVTPLLFFFMYVLRNLNTNILTEINAKKFLKYSAYTILSVMMLTVTYPLFNLISLAKNPVTYLKTVHGTVNFKKAGEAKDFDSVLKYIEINTTPDDYIFVTPWDAPPVYALADRKNPTYFDSLNDLLLRHSKEKQEKMCSDILRHKTKLIIHNADWGYDNKPEQQFRAACPILQNFIVTNYDLVRQFGFYSIYAPKNKI